MAKRTGSIHVLVAALTPLLAGCPRSLSAPFSADAGATVAVVDAGKPLTPVWNRGSLEMTEVPNAHARFQMDALTYQVSLYKLPPGTTLSVGGRAVPPSEDVARVDLAEVISRLSPGAVVESSYELDPKLDFELAVPGFAPLHGPMPPVRLASELAAWMAKSLDHPALFPRETSSDAPLAAHTILYTGAYGRSPDAFGPAATLRDVDWVAVRQALPPRRGGTCTVKDDDKTKRVTLSLVDEEVVVVERKTSRVVSRKTFPASTECPSYAYGDKADTSPDDEAIKRWLRDERTKS